MAAREALSQLAAMPEAAKLQGDSRTQVSQLISNFNELITTKTDWHASLAKVDANLTALIGADPTNPAANPTPSAAGTTGSGTTGTAGTTGTTPAGNAQIDPAIRAKLTEFRTHLTEFSKAAGGGTTSTEPSGDKPPTDTVPPSNPTAANPTNPANPPTATPANPPMSTPPPSSATDPAKPTGTTGSTAAGDPTATMSPADRSAASGAVSNADAQKELDAISAIIASSKTGALTKAQTAEIAKHLETLRTILNQK